MVSKFSVTLNPCLPNCSPFYIVLPRLKNYVVDANTSSCFAHVASRLANRSPLTARARQNGHRLYGRIVPDATPFRRVTISSRVFVGNIGFETSQDELETLFSTVGQVVEVVLPVDRATNQPRGFAFIEFSSPDAASGAIERIDGTELGGRNLRVTEARERTSRPSFASGGDAPRSEDRKRKPSRPKGSRRGVRGRKRGF